MTYKNNIRHSFDVTPSGQQQMWCLVSLQYPARNFTPTMPVWYENRPLGKNKLETMMREISKSAGLSKVYGNHRVRATAITAITAMSNASVSNRHIMAISGHRIAEVRLHCSLTIPGHLPPS